MWYNQFWGQIPLDLSKLSDKKLAQYENNMEFQNTFQLLYLTALNRYKWSIPETMDERALERALLLTGRVLVCDMGEGRLINLAGGASSSFNIYGYPLKAWGYGYNGFNKEFDLFLQGSDVEVVRQGAAGYASKSDAKAVLGYANANAYPEINYIINAAKRLADVMRSADVVVRGLKHPVLFPVSTDAEVNAVKEFYKRVEDNVPVIKVKKELAYDDGKVWDTKVSPQALSELRNHYTWLKNMELERQGTNTNDNPDKRERLLVDEVNANNEATENNADIGLVWRKKICDLTKSAFGVTIDVELRHTPTETDYMEESENVESVERDLEDD